MLDESAKVVPKKAKSYSKVAKNQKSATKIRKVALPALIFHPFLLKSCLGCSKVKKVAQNSKRCQAQTIHAYPASKRTLGDPQLCTRPDTSLVFIPGLLVFTRTSDWLLQQVLPFIGGENSRNTSDQMQDLNRKLHANPRLVIPYSPSLERPESSARTAQSLDPVSRATRTWVGHCA